jgi:HPt (histidine-containing phosphotransfer) domain-containing protein
MAESTTQIDMTYLQDMSGGDTAFVHEILATFLETSVDLVEAIAVASRDGDAEKAIYAGHTLKGSLRSIGAEPLAALCQDLEVAVRASDWDTFRLLAKQIPVGFERLRAEIETLSRDEAA